MTMYERRKAIVMVLFRRKKETLGNLAFEFSVSKRTIETDIEWLSTEVPLYMVAGNGGGIFIDEDYIPDMRFFTSEQTELMERILPHLKDNDRKNHDDRIRYVCISEMEEGESELIILTQIRQDLRDIRYYYSKQKMFDGLAKIVSQNDVISLYINNNTQATVAYDWDVSCEYIRMLNKSLCQFLQKQLE